MACITCETGFRPLNSRPPNSASKTGRVIRCCESIAGHRVVQVELERGQKLPETGDGAGVLFRTVQQAADPGLLGRGDPADVFSPVLHVAAITDPLDDPRIERVTPRDEIGELELGRGELGLCGGDAGIRGVIAARKADADHLHHLRGAVDVDLVYLRGEALVVGTQRLQHLPDDLVRLVVAQRLLGRDPGRHRHRQDHVAVVLAGGEPHHATDRLHDIDNAPARL